MLVTLRYHVGGPDEEVKKYIQGTGVHFIVVHKADEDDNVPHWHCLFSTTRTIKALREHLLYNLKIKKGNGGYSLKEIYDVEKFERYMCHGDGEGGTVRIISAQAPANDARRYSPEWAQEQHNLFYTKRREFNKKVKKDKLSIIEECVERGREIAPASRERICRLLVAVYKERRAPMNTFQMRAQLNTILCLLNNRDAEEDVINAILERV